MLFCVLFLCCWWCVRAVICWTRFFFLQKNKNTENSFIHSQFCFSTMFSVLFFALTLRVCMFRIDDYDRKQMKNQRWGREEYFFFLLLFLFFKNMQNETMLLISRHQLVCYFFFSFFLFTFTIFVRSKEAIFDSVIIVNNSFF